MPCLSHLCYSMFFWRFDCPKNHVLWPTTVFALQGLLHKVLACPDIEKACVEALMPLRYRRAQCSGVWHDTMDGVFAMAPIMQACLVPVGFKSGCLKLQAACLLELGFQPCLLYHRQWLVLFSMACKLGWVCQRQMTES